jgi:hypothetical protein
VLAKWLMFISIVTSCSTACMAQDQSKRTAAIKARYLSLLPQFIHWPAGTPTPIVIGTMQADRGESKYVNYLSKESKGQFVLKQFANPQAIQTCHILFLSSAVDPQIRAAAIARLKGQPVLIVGDSPNILNAGGAILFEIKENRMFLMISKSALRRTNLRADSGLLALDSVELVD